MKKRTAIFLSFALLLTVFSPRYIAAAEENGIFGSVSVTQTTSLLGDETNPTTTVLPDLAVRDSDFAHMGKGYNRSLAVFASLAMLDVNRVGGGFHMSVNLNGSADPFLTAAGFADIRYVDLGKLTFTENPYDITCFHLGRREYSFEGKTHVLYVISVAPTDSTFEQWYSNCDLGANTDEYEKATGNQKWDKENHKGFDVTAHRVLDVFADYQKDFDDSDKEVEYLVTGHSRGAGIANIIGAVWEDEEKTSSAYTFASPNTTTNSRASEYKTVFNLINLDDLVPTIPLSSWGFRRYGTDYCFSVAESFGTSPEGEASPYFYDTVLGKKYGGSRVYDEKNLMNENNPDMKLAGIATSRDDFYTVREPALRISATLMDIQTFTFPKTLDVLQKTGLDHFCQTEELNTLVILCKISPAFLTTGLARLLGGDMSVSLLLLNIAGAETSEKTESPYKTAINYLSGSVNTLMTGHDPMAYYIIGLNNNPTPETEQTEGSIFANEALPIILCVAGIAVGIVVGYCIRSAKYRKDAARKSGDLPPDENHSDASGNSPDK